MLLDGESVKSCTVLAVQADRAVGHHDGGALARPPSDLHPVAAAFRAEHGLQCGFCTPGMVMAAVGLLQENPHPTEREVREGLEGNLCRCTGYHNIVRAVLAAAGKDPDAAGRGLAAPSLAAPGLLHRERRVIPSASTTPAPTRWTAPLALLAEHGEDATLLAGGHSLLPVMKLRLAAPELVIDIGKLTELQYIRVEGDEIAIGAGTRHRTVEASEVLAAECPLLPAVARTVGDPQVRHRGTLGGSLAHADPASDLPAAVLALGGTVVLRSPRGERQVPITGFYTGVFSSVKEPDELIVEIRVPRTGACRLGVREVHPPRQRLGDRRGRRGRRPGGAGQHGLRPRCGPRRPRPRSPTAPPSTRPRRSPTRAPTRPPTSPQPRNTAATSPGCSPAAR